MARQMKASGVDWIGKVPVSWTLKRGQQLFKDSFEKVDMANLPMLLSLTKKGIVPRVMDGSGKYPASFETYQRVVPGDFVFCLFDVAETPRTVGYVQHDGMITGAYSAFKTNGVHRYMEYMLIGIDDIKALQPYYSGMRNVIQKRTFQKLLYPSPTQQEQMAIASYLDDRTTTIDSKIQLLEEKSKSLTELRKSVVHQAVTKGLDPNVAMKPSGVDWIGDVPAHWQLRRNKDVFNKIKTRNAIELPAGSLSYGEVVYKDEKTLTSETKGTYQAVRKGHFLLNPINLNFDLVSLRIGLSAIDVCVSSAYLVFSNFTGDSQYLKYALRMFDIYYMKTLGAGVRQTLRYDEFAKSLLVSPAHEEQVAIAQYLDERTAIIDESIKTIADQISAMKSLRQSLIHEAVTGKIDVADYGYHYA